MGQVIRWSLPLGFQNPGGDDEALDFGGAFVDFGDAGVAVVALDGIFAAVAIAAVDLDGFVGDAGGHFAGEEFGDGGVHAIARASVLLPGGFADEEARGVDFRGHVREHKLNGLKLRDGMAKGETLFGIFQRGFKSALGDSNGLRGDADAAAIERGESDFVAFAFVADAVGGWHFAVSENQFAAGGGADAKFFFFLAGFEAGRAFFDDEGGDAFFAFFRMRADVNDGRVGRAAVGDPGFCAVDEVLVAAKDSFGLESSGVRACLRLGERVAADFFAARVWQKELLFLVVGAVAVDGIAVEGILDGENHAGGSAAAGNLLDHNGVSDMIEPGATLRFGKSNACEAELRGFGEESAGEVAGFVEFFGDGPDFRFGELANCFLEERLFFGEIEIHGWE
jgi:hypothetical protein